MFVIIMWISRSSFVCMHLLVLWENCSMPRPLHPLSVRVLLVLMFTQWFHCVLPEKLYHLELSLKKNTVILPQHRSHFHTNCVFFFALQRIVLSSHAAYFSSKHETRNVHLQYKHWCQLVKSTFISCVQHGCGPTKRPSANAAEVGWQLFVYWRRTRILCLFALRYSCINSMSASTMRTTQLFGCVCLCVVPRPSSSSG